MSKKASEESDNHTKQSDSVKAGDEVYFAGWLWKVTRVHDGEVYGVCQTKDFPKDSGNQERCLFRTRYGNKTLEIHTGGCQCPAHKG